MHKRVLVVYYSQSGDVRRALRSLVAPLRDAAVEVTWLRLDTVPGYPFPWRTGAFFGCMPEAVNGEPPPAASPATEDDADLDPARPYDLVIIGWQVWFLSPSLPVQAFFAAPHAKLLRGARVVSVVCCRQMWHRACARMRSLVDGAGGVVTDNVVVTHQGSTVAGYLTAPRLMLTGRREGSMILPDAGVAGEAIDAMERFGRRLRDTASRWTAAEPAPLLTGMRAAEVKAGALLPELVGVGLMVTFARLARWCGRPGSLARRPVIWLFVLVLVALVPPVLLASALLTPVLSRVFAGRLARYRRTVEGHELPQA